MVVKDEASQIEACLDPIISKFAQVAVVDTGSVDGTPDILRQRYRIEPLCALLDTSRCECLSDARHTALQTLSTPWILLLDADERVAPSAIDRISLLDHDERVAGYFARWVNHLDGGTTFDDYKLFLFRNGLRPVGLVHDVVQLDMRARGLHGVWLKEMTVRHFPETERRDGKVASYRARLRCAIRREPHFLRYHWFLGYMDFLEGEFESARDLLLHVISAESRAFPVETLNSVLVISEIFARWGDVARLHDTLERAMIFYDAVAADFEVAVNFRLKPWLIRARWLLSERRLTRIRAYRFAC